MIGWLGGIVRWRDPTAGVVILDVGGVGYQLAVSWQTFGTIGDAGERCELWVHTHAREDVLALFGFSTWVERRMFQLLTSVPQVGPRNALAVLGGFPLIELVDAISSGERGLLERIPGVGKRTAERILLDLSEKVGPLRAQLEPSGRESVTPAAATHDRVREDARAVLINLGWKIKAVETTLDKVLADEVPDNLDAVVRRALAELMAR